MGGNLVEGVYSNCDGENFEQGSFQGIEGENHVTCSRESARARGDDNCIPECSPGNHMETLHLTLDGKDYRLTCRSKRGIFSWVQNIQGDPGEIDGEKAIPWMDETSDYLQYPPEPEPDQ